MASSSITSPSKTAFLTLDLQPCIFALAAVPDYVLANAVKSVEFARRKGTQVIHIGIAFSEGYPELDGIVEGGGKEAKAREGRNEWQLWASMKSLSTCLLHQPSTQPHPSLVQPTDSVVFRSRGSAFSRPTLTGDPSSPTLASLLEERGIKHLVLAGVATSGIVLSTVREAWDKDFAITVLGDGCWDPDEVSCATSLIFMIYEGGFSDRLMG
ncbi:hypothetical protein MMC10_006252 [Thelotrema lepadinum]|nr:hypothetical protein [Thelotrema lepadinum]